MAPSVSSPPNLVFFCIVSPGRHSERIYSSCNIRSIGYLRSAYGTIDTCPFRQAFPKSCGFWIVCVAKNVRSERFGLPNWISRHEEDLYAFLWSKQASSVIGSPVSCLWKVVWKEVLGVWFPAGFHSKICKPEVWDYALIVFQCSWGERESEDFFLRPCHGFELDLLFEEFMWLLNFLEGN